MIAALTEKGEEFAFSIGSATDRALEAIEEKGLSFSRTVLDNSTEISDLINTAGENASTSVSRTMTELQENTQQAIARSQESATATVKSIEETHNMLRSDSVGLFERLREANTMLQEVLSGAHENMNSLENTLMLRVSEFVTAMNEVTGSTTEVTTRVENNITGFREVTAQVITDLGQLANQFDDHGRELSQSLAMMDRSNQRTEDAVNQRRVQLDDLVKSLDTRTDDIQQRLNRFSGLLDESLEAAAARAREVARVVSDATAEGTRAISDQYERVREHAEEVARAMLESSAEGTRMIGEQYEHMRAQAEDVSRAVAESSAEGARALSEQYDRIRANAEDERRRTVETMRSVYQQTSGDTDALFRDAAGRFAEVMENMKEMAAEMHRELEGTRADLRRGIFELPQETAESAAQMRRVIVDQIEALAELNRIVARHGRNIDATEPMRRPAREEPTLAVVGGRGSDLAPRGDAPARSELPPRSTPPRPSQPRNEIPGFAPAPRRPEPPAPAAPPVSNDGSNRGWLSDLLSRASQEPEPPAREFPAREPARAGARRRRAHAAPHHRVAGLAVGRHRAHDRPRGRRRFVGPLQARRTQRVHPPALYLAGPEGVRRDPPQVPRRPRVQADGRRLHRPLRAAVGRCGARRPEPDDGAHLPHLGDRQGLHHAGARGRTLRLKSRHRATPITTAAGTFRRPFFMHVARAQSMHMRPLSAARYKVQTHFEMLKIS